MAGVSTALTIGALAAGAGAGIYQGHQAKKAGKAQRRAMEEQRLQQEQMLQQAEEEKAQFETQMGNEQKRATATMQNQHAAQRRGRGRGAQGRSGTILTSPLGVQDVAQTVSRSLLGM